ncbi:MAG TPA: ABC transporter ATP-binding protein [Gemmatimonadaceae bacterium]|nr:ABC transporter ATP-binding protein [Gemmatimonadaceae bacterium]
MIEIDRLVVRYPGSREPALRGVSLEAPRGRLTAVVGPNGSGKTTIVRALLRAQAADSGEVRVDGARLTSIARRDLARRVAVITQHESLVFPLPVREYVALGRYPHEGPWRAEGREDADAVALALEQAGISSLASRSTAELSGGEWQRARLARALAQSGEAIVLDEPTTFLDIAHEMAVFELFAALARAGKAVLLVSHQLNLVARFADSIVLLDRGVVAAAGAPTDVMRAEVLEAVYDWPLVVLRDPAVGAPALLPLRLSRPLSATSRPSPHTGDNRP